MSLLAGATILGRDGGGDEERGKYTVAIA